MYCLLQFLKVNLSLLAIVLVSSNALSQEPSIESTQTEQVKAAIITWSNSLESFSGSYTLTQINLGQDRISAIQQKLDPESYPKAFYWRVVLCWEDDNCYFKLESLSGKDDSETHAMYNGIYDFLNQKKHHPYGVANDSSRTEFPIPWGVYLTPGEIFGHRKDYTLADVLAAGTTRILERNGKRILSHVNREMEKAVDIMLDDNDRITGIEWVHRPFSYQEDALREVWNGDLFDLRTKKITLNFLEYSDIDGVVFPSKVEKVWWAMDEAAASSVNAQFEAGQISQYELIAGLYTVPVHESTIQTFQLERALLNVPLSEGDFQINWPDGAKVYDAQRSLPKPGEIIYPEKRKGVWIATAVAGSIVFLLMAGIMLYHRKN